MVGCIACEFKLKPSEAVVSESGLHVQRYDRLESRYLTTGDFSALQQMNTEYPMETRTLIEDVLKLGLVYEPNINSRFLAFYQDSLLQVVISDVEAEFANMDDLNEKFQKSFSLLEKEFPQLKQPIIYAQIGAFTQSIVVGNGTIGISLDKYMGASYPPYARFYDLEQRKMMTREYIVPDALVFYLLSQYPLKNFDARTQEQKDLHVGKVMWIVNEVTGRKFFNTSYVNRVEDYVKKHPVSMQKLLENVYLKGL